jgi:hypothetical protein
MSHTPGPWIVDETVALGAYGVWKDVRHTDEPMQRICSVFDNNKSDVPREQRDANARLIAAAPDLLASLEYMRNVHNPINATDEVGRQYKSRHASTAFAQAEAAIAKAKGE